MADHIWSENSLILFKLFIGTCVLGTFAEKGAIRDMCGVIAVGAFVGSYLIDVK